MIAALRPIRELPLSGTALWACIFTILGVVLLRNYLQPDNAALWTGLGTCVLIAGNPSQGRGSNRYGWVALGFSLLYFVLPVGTARYMAIGTAGLLLLERARGRQSWLLPLSLLIMSPVFANIAGTIAFPLRLELTRIAGNLMAAAGLDVHASGNLIRSGGAEFSVDPACVGLHMLQCALLCGIAMMAACQQRSGTRLSWLAGCCLLLCCTLLNVASNLLRIVLLVQFRFAPGTAMHELIGVLCLVGYVLLPCGFLGSWMTRRFGIRELRGEGLAERGGGHLILAAIALSLLIGELRKPPEWDRTAQLPQIPGYAVTRASAGVVRLAKGEAVVYLKDLQGFYGSEHHPLLCWTGSGYRFSELRRLRIGDLHLICGNLEHEGRRYVTGWWYSDGGAHEFADAGWRWDALTSGRGYSIVNVTAPDDATLARCIRELKAAPSLNSWLARVDR